jgi:hypothetical protein
LRKKKVFRSYFISVFLLLVLFSVLFSSLVEGNPIYNPGGLIVATIEKPYNNTYTTNTIPLVITTGDHQFPSTGYYSVDDRPEIKINENGPTVTYKTTLHLPDGKHTIHVRTESVGSACADRSFTINTTRSTPFQVSPTNLQGSPTETAFLVEVALVDIVTIVIASLLGYVVLRILRRQKKRTLA